MLKKIAITFAAIAATMMCAGAQAKVWNYAEVLIVGNSFGGGSYIRLNSINSEDYSFSNKLFKISEENRTIAMAISMAAATSNRQIFIESNIDALDGSQTPTIYSIYLTKELVTSN